MNAWCDCETYKHMGLNKSEFAWHCDVCGGIVEDTARIAAEKERRNMHQSLRVVVDSVHPHSVDEFIWHDGNGQMYVTNSPDGPPGWIPVFNGGLDGRWAAKATPPVLRRLFLVIEIIMCCAVMISGFAFANDVPWLIIIFYLLLMVFATRELHRRIEERTVMTKASRWSLSRVYDWIMCQAAQLKHLKLFYHYPHVDELAEVVAKEIVRQWDAECTDNLGDGESLIYLGNERSVVINVVEVAEAIDRYLKGERK